jgi:hypothetical protein
MIRAFGAHCPPRLMDRSKQHLSDGPRATPMMRYGVEVIIAEARRDEGRIDRLQRHVVDDELCISH